MQENIRVRVPVLGADYAGSLKNLEQSLRRLRTDHLDLWQFHEMVYDNDPDWVFEKGGMRAALEARQAGKARFSIMGLPSKDFPVFPQVDEPALKAIDRDAFSETSAPMRRARPKCSPRH